MNFSSSPIPWSLSTPDGTLAKTCKASVMHLLKGECWQDVTINEIFQNPCMLLMVTHLFMGWCGYLTHLQKLQIWFSKHCQKILSTNNFGTDSYYVNSVKMIEHFRQRKCSDLCTKQKKTVTGALVGLLAKTTVHCTHKLLYVSSFPTGGSLMTCNYQSKCYQKSTHKKTYRRTGIQ